MSAAGAFDKRIWPQEWFNRLDDATKKVYSMYFPDKGLGAPHLWEQVEAKFRNHYQPSGQESQAFLALMRPTMGQLGGDGKGREVELATATQLVVTMGIPLHALGAAELAYYCKFAYLRADEHKRLEACLTASEHGIGRTQLYELQAGEELAGYAQRREDFFTKRVKALTDWLDLHGVRSGPGAGGTARAASTTATEATTAEDHAKDPPASPSCPPPTAPQTAAQQTEATLWTIREEIMATERVKATARNNTNKSKAPPRYFGDHADPKLAPLQQEALLARNRQEFKKRFDNSLCIRCLPADLEEVHFKECKYHGKRVSPDDRVKRSVPGLQTH